MVRMMGEHVFDEPGNERRMPPARDVRTRRRQISRAIELAERVLEETSSASQDWTAVARMAAELTGLAARLEAVPAGARTTGAQPSPNPFRTRCGPVPLRSED
jgi:hypothetical protein